MIYILFFGILCLLSYLFEMRKVNIFLSTLIIGTLLSLLIGLRGIGVGNDTATYVQIFNEQQGCEDVLKSESRFEIGYIILMRIIGLITHNPHVMLCIIAFLTVMPFIYTINKYSDIPWFSIALIFCLGFFKDSLNIIRQCLVMAYVFAAMPLLLKRRVIPYTIIVLFLSMFHATAIFALFLVPFVYINIKDSYVLTYIVLCIIVTIFFNKVLILLARIFPQYTHYFAGSYFSGEGKLASLKNLLISLFYIFLIIVLTGADLNKPKLMGFGLNDDTGTSHIMEWSMVITAGLQIIAFAANIIDRITPYFYIVWLLYLPKIAMAISNKNARRWFITAIILVCIVEFTVVRIYRPEWNSILPYKFYWQE